MNKQFQEILQLGQSGNVAEALKRCERFIKKKPHDTNWLLLAASFYAQNNQYEAVKDYCLRAARLEPRNTNALYNLSIACLFTLDYQGAIKYSLSLIKLNNNHAGAYENLGLAYWHTGDLVNARKHALIADKFDSNSATNQNNLGLIYKSLQQTDKAIACFRKAIKYNPQLAEACYNCGTTLLEQDNESGNALLDKALRINPSYPEANNYKGLQLLNNNEAKKSIYFFQQAISAKTDYAEAYCHLGNALMIERQFKSAENMYRKAIEFNPDYASAYNNLGNALLDQDNYKQNHEEAIHAYLKAIELAPEMDDTYKNLAVCYQGEGFHEEALHYFKIYNERAPGNEVVIAGMASVHERRGEYDEGRALIEPFIHNNDVSADIILAYAKLAQYFKQQDTAITLLINTDDTTLSKKLKIEKYYALGKLTGKGENIDKNFSYYQQANNLEEDSFDLHQEKIKFNNIQSFFTEDKLQHLSRASTLSKLPIFIVGMPRSGTSLAEQILASHPDIYGAGELENLHNLIQIISAELEPKDKYPACLDSMSIDYANKTGNDYLQALQQLAPEANYIVDKMPHNFMGLAVISLLFPKATIIHCKRSSIDTCLSIYFQHFNKHHSYSNSLKMLGDYYHLYADLMAHWKKVLDINIIELNYEDVIANPEQEMKNLLAQCNIEWNPACLNFHQNKRTVMTPSYDQVRQPIYTTSVAKWKKYEHHLGELIEALGDRAC